MADFTTLHEYSLDRLNSKWKAAFTVLVLGYIFYLTNPARKLRSRLLEGSIPLSGQDGFIDRVGTYLPVEWRLDGSATAEIWPGSQADNKEEVAICGAVRDQHEDMKEWLTHHYYHLGIRRFYILDDASKPHLSTFGDWPIPSSSISFHYFSNETRAPMVINQQLALYNFCNKKFGHLHRWIGYIDIDEFVEILDQPGISMAKFLQHYQQHGALGISWAVHNSNGILTRPASVRKAFNSCIDDYPEQPYTRHVKSFVQTKYAVRPESPHNFVLNGSMVQVDENGNRFAYAFRTPTTRDKIVLHHYMIKSRQEMQEKIDRWKGDESPRDWETWDTIEGFKTYDCNSLARYRP